MEFLVGYSLRGKRVSWVSNLSVYDCEVEHISSVLRLGSEETEGCYLIEGRPSYAGEVEVHVKEVGGEGELIYYCLRYSLHDTRSHGLLLCYPN